MTCSLGTWLPLSWSYDTTALSCEARIPFQVILMERKHMETIHELDTVLFDDTTWLWSNTVASSHVFKLIKQLQLPKTVGTISLESCGFWVCWLREISFADDKHACFNNRKYTYQCTTPTFDGRSPTTYDNAVPHEDGSMIINDDYCPWLSSITHYDSFLFLRHADSLTFTNPL